MGTAPSNVLYLIGTTRCGSTLLGSLLGQVPGIVHVGEIARIWEEGFVADYRCGCGEHFSACAFWRAVIDKAFGGRDQVDPQRMVDAVNRFARTRHTLKLVTERGRRQILDGMAEYSEAMARLYAAVLAVSGATTVLDSSKTPLLAWVASEHPRIALRVLHVTRDPRAVSYSWQRAKFDPAKGEDMHRESTVRSSLAWLTWNSVAAALWQRPDRRGRYFQLRYEDLTANPRAVLDEVLTWLGEPVRASALVDADGKFRGTPAHTIAGNPMRFHKGSQRIATDTEWHDAMSAWDQLVVVSMTWPLLGRYRYPVLAGR